LGQSEKAYLIQKLENSQDKKKLSTMRAALTPYLTFNGNASEAMKFYQTVLGGDLSMSTFGEMNQASSPEEKNRIIHAVLKNDSLSLFASDGHMDDTVKFGDNISLSLAGQNAQWLTDVFNKLSEGANVTMPLAKQFWGATFGMLTDRFGIHWMINIDSPESRTM
jgi:PhnB protein